jgi:hypothetical protein
MRFIAFDEQAIDAIPTSRAEVRESAGACGDSRELQWYGGADGG